MNEWKNIKLKEVLKEVSERNKGEKIKRVLSVTNSKGFVNQDEYFEGTVHSADISNYKIIRKNQFAYNPSRVNVGSIDILKDYEEGVLSPMYIVFEVDTTKLLPEYFKYYLETNRFDENVKNNTQGSVRNSLSFKALANFDYLLPPIEEQKKIVDLMKKVYLIDENINKEIEKMKKVKGYYLNKIFNQKGNNIKKIDDIANIYIGLTYTPTYTTEGIPFISCKNLKNGKIDWSDYNFISEKEFEMITNNAKPQKGDILFGRVGSLGNPVILEENKKICIFVSVGYIRIKDHCKCFNGFLVQWMNSSNFKKMLEQKIAGSSQKNLNTGWLKKFEINIPILKDQIKWSKLFELYDEHINNLKKKEKEYEKLKKGLMQQLLTGKVRVKI